MAGATVPGSTRMYVGGARYPFCYLSLSIDPYLFILYLLLCVVQCTVYIWITLYYFFFHLVTVTVLLVVYRVPL